MSDALASRRGAELVTLSSVLAILDRAKQDIQNLAPPFAVDAWVICRFGNHVASTVVSSQNIGGTWVVTLADGLKFRGDHLMEATSEQIHEATRKTPPFLKGQLVMQDNPAWPRPYLVESVEWNDWSGKWLVDLSEGQGARHADNLRLATDDEALRFESNRIQPRIGRIVRHRESDRHYRCYQIAADGSSQWHGVDCVYNGPLADLLAVNYERVPHVTVGTP